MDLFCKIFDVVETVYLNREWEDDFYASAGVSHNDV